MLLDNYVEIVVRSPNTLYKLKNIGIASKIGDIVEVNINDLWEGSNIIVNVKCEICDFEKKIQYNLYNKNRRKYNIYTCSNRCSSFKNKLTKKKNHNDENYVNVEKSRKTKLDRYGSTNYVNVEKIKKTKLDRYGDENYNNIEKTKQTNLDRYGVEYSFLSEDVIEKIKNTNFLKFGNTDFRKSEYVKEKIKSTLINKYGVDSYMKTFDFREKSKITSLEKYGFDSPNKSEIIKKKKLDRMLAKYGCISNSQTKSSKEKLVKTNLDRYGVEYPMQVLEFFEKQQKNSKKIEKYNENIYYQGSYEKHFLDYSNNIGIIDKIKRGPVINYKFNNEYKTYFSDFYYIEMNLIIEIKSSYYFNKYYDKNISKMNKCLESGYNFIFIIDKNYKYFEKLIKNPL